MTRARSGTLALLLVGLAALAGPAYAAGAVFPGRHIEPGTNVQESLHVGTGLYTVTVPQDDTTEQYVEIDRTIPGSTIWYGASAVTPTSSDTSPTLYLSSSPNGTGDSCVDYEGVGGQVDQSSLATTLFSTDSSPACRKASSIVLRVYSQDVPAGDYQLVVWEEPPVTDQASLPDPGSVTWGAMTGAQPEPLTVGTTYADAPTPGDGTWRVHVDRGAPALIRVPLTWGQHAQVSATSTDKVAGFATVSFRWLSPLGGTLPDTSYNSGGPPVHELLVDGSGDPAGSVTPTVAWKNRQGDEKTTPAAFAGDYYLALDATDEDLPADGVDLTLTMDTVTDFPSQAPTYEQDPPPLPYVDGSTSEPAPSERAEDSAPERDWALAGALFGAAALFAGGGALALGRRRARA